jgi:hypothetical protein
VVVSVFADSAKATQIFPIATNGAVSQTGIYAAFGKTNYLVGIEGDAVEHYDITAQLVSTNGSLIGSRIAVGRTGGVPAVAFDGTNFLMLWEDDALHPIDQIYGQFVNQSGALVGSPFDISTTDENADFGSFQGVAFDGRNYFVIWTDASGSDSPSSDAYGVLVSPAGSLVMSKTLLSTNA